MLFVSLAIFSIYLYIRGYKISALVLFFFFLTRGFNLVPNELVDIGTPLTKSADYAFFILLGFLIIEFIFNRKLFTIDTFVKFLLLFFSFLFICIFYNKLKVGIDWSEIIRTVRPLFFWFAYFILRNMKKEQIQSLLKVLFSITVFTSGLYILQIIFDQSILVKAAQSTTVFLGMDLPRFYNQPDMLFFFVFLGIYHNPYKGTLKYFTIATLVLALLGGFHRSQIGFFFIALILGFILKLPKLRTIQILAVGGFFLLFITLFLGSRFLKYRSVIDITTVLTKGVENLDVDYQNLENATFSFRMAHLYERNEYIKQNPLRMILGGGLVTEDSRKVDKMFDFKVGVVEELTSETTQLDTADISYSFLLIRYGYLGTILFLSLYFYLLYFFFKHKNNPYGFLSLLYFIMIFGTSFFSSNLLNPITFLIPLMSYIIIQKDIKVVE